ncbi:hypothetical protein [Halosimplex sp. TS25]|uniref:hypothetical protein n=1 Tax=Halosimplex rarum TaxID=3396619 RepID=UPI0039E81A3A
MNDYTTADWKPSGVLINYNLVRGAELKAIYEYIEAQGETSVQQVVDSFAPKRDGERKEDNARQCVDFLNSIDMVNRPDSGQPIELQNESILPDLGFEARVLFHLREQAEPRDYFSRIYDVSLREADRSIPLDSLLPDVRREFEREFDWNLTKLRMWRSLMVQLGLISETDNRGLILSPCRALIFDVLTAYDRRNESNDLIDLMEWVQEHFFEVFDSKTGTPSAHPAFADVLQNMESDDILTLRGMADAQNEVKLPATRQNPTDRSIKSFSVDVEDGRDPYQYPLEQSTLGVQR